MLYETGRRMKCSWRSRLYKYEIDNELEGNMGHVAIQQLLGLLSWYLALIMVKFLITMTS